MNTTQLWLPSCDLQDKPNLGGGWEEAKAGEEEQQAEVGASMNRAEAGACDCPAGQLGTCQQCVEHDTLLPPCAVQDVFDLGGGWEDEAEGDGQEAALEQVRVCGRVCSDADVLSSLQRGAALHGAALPCTEQAARWPMMAISKRFSCTYAIHQSSPAGVQYLQPVPTMGLLCFFF